VAGFVNRRTFLAVIAGVLVAILTVSGLFVYPQLSTKTAGSVSLNGVWVNVTYVPRSLKPWPVSSSSCTDSILAPPSYHCPIDLTGGTEFSVLAFLPVPLNDTAFINDTVWSPIPFHEPSCQGYPPCPLTNLWVDRNWTVAGGFQWGVVVTLAVPSPAPNVPQGFWVTANVTVRVVAG
jgi:hypothetical protein